MAYTGTAAHVKQQVVWFSGLYSQGEAVEVA